MRQSCRLLKGTASGRSSAATSWSSLPWRKVCSADLGDQVVAVLAPLGTNAARRGERRH